MSGWIIGALVFVWVIALLLGSVSEGSNLFTVSSVMTTSNSPLTLVETWVQQDWGALVTPTNWSSYFSDLWKMATLDFPMFGNATSNFQLVRWLIFIPFAAILMWGFISIAMSFFQRTV